MLFYKGHSLKWLEIIKVRAKLSHSIKAFLVNLGEVCESHNASYETVCRWRKIFHIGPESVKEAAKSGRPVIATGRSNVSKLCDGRYEVQIHSKAHFESRKDR